jgi:hypothetical protein
LTPTPRRRIFLLSPANVGGIRGGHLLGPNGKSELARRLRGEGAPLGEVFSFISELYFRGKLAYAEAFADPPPEVPGAMIITTCGLTLPHTIVTLDRLQQLASVPIDAADPRYRLPLERDCRALLDSAGEDTDFVLLGSVATGKYLDPMFAIFGHRLLFPEDFAGRGDMSRGGLLLRAARAGEPLRYVPIGSMTRHGARPAKLPKLPRR